MNITVDKAASVEALSAAQVAFLNTAKQLRIANNPALAYVYEQRADVIYSLLLQIHNNGGKVAKVA